MSLADVDQIRTANSTALAEFRTSFDTASTDSIANNKAQVDAMLKAAQLAHTSALEETTETLTAQQATATEKLQAIEDTESEVMNLAAALGTGARSAG